MALRIGDHAPNFTADTTQGPVELYDWKRGKWAMLLSLPRDFTPVGTTELGVAAGLKAEFDRRRMRVLALSVDTVARHHRWAVDIEQTQGVAPNFPVIDDGDGAIAGLYNLVRRDLTDTEPMRSVFVIGPDNRIELVLSYPASTGHNFVEILRAIDSLQLAARHPVATPANWQPGDACMLAPELSDAEAAVHFPEGWIAVTPYLRVVPHPPS